MEGLGAPLGRRWPHSEGGVAPGQRACAVGPAPAPLQRPLGGWLAPPLGRNVGWRGECMNRPNWGSKDARHGGRQLQLGKRGHPDSGALRGDAHLGQGKGGSRLAMGIADPRCAATLPIASVIERGVSIRRASCVGSSAKAGPLGAPCVKAGGCAVAGTAETVEEGPTGSGSAGSDTGLPTMIPGVAGSRSG